MNDHKIQQEVHGNKKFMNRLFMACIGLLIVLLVLSLIYAGYKILEQEGGTVFEFSAVCIMTLWIALIIGYYAWAIYFYNINLGLTNQDWADIRIKKSIDPTFEERDQNPNREHTLGLPPGTVRGTLTLTLMIAAVALTIAYMGESNSLDNNQFFIDNFDFFKQAFLMMIAFYFGSKSLEYITKNGKTSEDPIENGIAERPKGKMADNIDVTVENIDTDTVDFADDFEGDLNYSDSDFNKEGSVG